MNYCTGPRQINGTDYRIGRSCCPLRSNEIRHRRETQAQQHTGDGQRHQKLDQRQT
jgi:hypothetical protein